MKDIVILTSYGDIHAAAVSWALSRIGESPKLWFGCEFPQEQEASMKIDNSGLTEFVISGALGTLVREKQVKTVWNRRPSMPVLPSKMHESDKPVAQRECDRFFNSLVHELTGTGFWVNPKENAIKANHKANQLTVAVNCGLMIPDTLLSNSQTEIKHFFEKHHGDIIYKAFIQPHWQSISSEISSTFFTTSMPEEALNAAFSLKHVPGIYQPRVKKQYEIRLTIAGGHAFAVKIDSQSDPLAAMDWRQDVGIKCKLSAATIPQEVLLRCRELMSKLGLVFGCIDLIVTPNDEYIFLEVNEMGQFLWLDYHLPELRMLEIFAGFLASGDAFYDERPKRDDISFRQFLETEEYAIHRQETETTKPSRALAVKE